MARAAPGCSEGRQDADPNVPALLTPCAGSARPTSPPLLTPVTSHVAALAPARRAAVRASPKRPGCPTLVPMPGTPSHQALTRLIGLLLLAIVVAAVGFAVHGALQPHAPKRPPMVAEPPGGEESDLARTQRLAAVDSSEKTTWVDEIPELDVSMLTPARRELFIRFANAQSCTCGCGFTLAACRRYDSLCDVSLPRVERLRDSVAAGLLTRAHGLRQRPVDAVR